jgi:hypothetical protein
MLEQRGTFSRPVSLTVMEAMLWHCEWPNLELAVFFHSSPRV